MDGTLPVSAGAIRETAIQRRPSSLSGARHLTRIPASESGLPWEGRSPLPACKISVIHLAITPELSFEGRAAFPGGLFSSPSLEVRSETR